MKDWNPDPFPTMVHNSLIKIVNTSLIRCGKQTIPTANDVWTPYPTTKYQWVRKADTDKRRISCIPVSALKAKSLHTYKNKDDIERRNRYYTSLNSNDVGEQFREEKGLYLKPGRLLEILDIQPDSCLCSEIATLLRQAVNPDTSTVSTTYTPSEVYVKQHSKSGSTNSSCMIGLTEERFRLYDDLENTGIAYIEEDNIIVARALIHDEVIYINNIVKVMDRIYSADDDYEAIMIQWAVNNGFWRKTKQCLNCEEYVTPTGEIIENPILSIDCHYLEDEDYEEVPYVDTFAYYNSDTTLSNTTNRSKTYFKSIEGNDSDGYLIQPKCVCYACDCELTEDEAYTRVDAIYCQECYHERYGVCDICEDTEPRSELTWVESTDQIVCDYCLDRHFTRCGRCGSMEADGEVTTVDNADNDRIQVCNDCIDNYTQCNDCDGYYENTHTTGDDYEVCDDCWSEYSKCDECGGQFKEIQEVDGKDICKNCMKEVEDADAIAD